MKLTPNPYEQRFVLAEAIKTSSVPVDKLISFVDDRNVQPVWDHMLLPLGKSFSPSAPEHAAKTETSDRHETKLANHKIKVPLILTPLQAEI